MLTIGVDAHKHIHVALALDQTGTILGHWQGPNSPDGWSSLWQWSTTLASQSQSQSQWGIEGAWNYGRGLAQYLVSAGEVGETVYEINPRWTAQRRGRNRKPGKSDRLDAYAVAQLVREEGSRLPRVTTDDPSSVLDLLVREREDTLAEATRLGNQLHQLLLWLDPEYKQHLPGLRTRRGLQALVEYTTTSTNQLNQQRAASVRRLGARLRLALDDAAVLAKQIRNLAQAHYEPLTEICGVELLTAGALAGILGPGQRFANEAQLALHAGVAPLEVSSAGRVRHRLNRGGNRRLNSILHRMAVTQSRYSEEAQRYLARRQAEGKTKREARRALKRYLVRAVWRAWHKCPESGMRTTGSAQSTPLIADGEAAEEGAQVQAA